VLETVRLLAMRARTRGRLRVARDVRVAAGARVRVARGARVVLGRGAVLGARARIEAVGGVVRVGRGARLGDRVVVVAHAGVSIGARAVVGDWAALSDVAPTWDDVERPVREQPLRVAPIAVGEGAVLGPHAALGPGAVVGAGEELAPYAVLPGLASGGVRRERPGRAAEPRG
jgi:acetyltransferase-like isoleucine patch superfamily enzyme